MNTQKFHKRLVSSVKLTPCMQRMITFGNDKSISVFDFDTNK
jgi:hypothetical protein